MVSAVWWTMYSLAENGSDRFSLEESLCVMVFGCVGEERKRRCLRKMGVLVVRFISLPDSRVNRINGGSALRFI